MDFQTKYEDGEIVNQTGEQFNQLSKDMSSIKMSDAGKAGQMVKDVTKELGFNENESVIGRIPLLGKLAKKAENKLIDTMTAEQVLTRYEKELIEEETKAKITKADIKQGILKNKQIITEVDSKIAELTNDIETLDQMEANGEYIVEDVPGTTRNRMMSFLTTLQTQRADAQSRTIQYGVQLVLAENILTGFNDVRLSVTTTLRDSMMQAQIISQQEQYIKSVGDAKELIRNVKLDNAERLNKMAANASNDIYQYQQDAETLKKITDINYSTITNITELNKSIEEGRKVLLDTFEQIEKSASTQLVKCNQIQQVANSTNDSEKQQLIEQSGVEL